MSDHVINPQTGKPIKVGGPTHKKLIKQGILEDESTFMDDDFSEKQQNKPSIQKSGKNKKIELEENDDITEDELNAYLKQLMISNGKDDSEDEQEGAGYDEMEMENYEHDAIEYMNNTDAEESEYEYDYEYLEEEF